LLKNGDIEIIYINKNELINQYSNSILNKETIFKCLTGNSRGIEFNKIFFEKIINNSLFHIKISFKHFDCDTSDPIIKRLKMLSLIC